MDDPAQARTSHTLIAEPPYDSARVAGATVPDVGAILIVADDNPGTALIDWFTCQRAFPWCPICIACAELGNELEKIRALESWPGLTIVAPHHCGGFDSLAAAAATAVRARPVPEPAALSRYIERRLGIATIATHLARCFGLVEFGIGPTDGFVGASRSTTARQLRALGALTPRDWSALGRLAVAARPSQWTSAEAFALTLGLDPRTLRRRVAHLLGWSIRRYAGTIGWEPILEQALRRHCRLVTPTRLETWRVNVRS